MLRAATDTNHADAHEQCDALRASILTNLEGFVMSSLSSLIKAYTASAASTDETHHAISCASPLGRWPGKRCLVDPPGKLVGLRRNSVLNSMYHVAIHTALHCHGLPEQPRSQCLSSIDSESDKHS